MVFTDNTKSEFNRNAGLDSNGVYTVFGEIPKGISGKTFEELLKSYYFASHPGLINNYVVKTTTDNTAITGVVCYFLVEGFAVGDTHYSLMIKPRNPEKDNLDILLINDYYLGEYISWDMDKNNVRYPRLLNYFIIKLKYNFCYIKI